MLDKKISFSGFELDQSEQEKVNEVVEKYLKRIEERINDYEELKLRLKKSLHGKAFLHEVEGDLVIKGKVLSAACTDYNLYLALAEVFEKLLGEISHNKRNARQQNEKEI